MSHPFNPLRIAAPIVIVLVALLVPASGAFASTLSSNGTTVTFTAATGAGGQFLGLDEQTADDLTINTADDPVVYDDDGNTDATITPDCEDADGDTESPASVVECTDIVTVVANTNSGDDLIDASDNYCCESPANVDGLTQIVATVNGGIGEDEMYGGDAAGGDNLRGDDAADYMEGSDGADDLAGGTGQDELYGQNGGDLLRGGGDDDYLNPGEGADDSDGEAGNDSTDEFDDGDVDQARGGTGVDDLFYDAGCCGGSDDDLTINENGANDDGDGDDDPDNDFDGFENVDFDIDSAARADVLTTNGNDSIDGDSEVDVFTPRAGVDFVDMGDNDDTANTVDGYPDVVECGDGDDTANADQFDELRHCEDVNITQVESAFDDPDNPDDFPPNVAFSNLDPNQFLPPVGQQLEATANDDNGVVLVVFFDDTERLCDDTTAPYTCGWTQTSDDVGDNTLTVFAVDTAGQFGADLLNVVVGKFNPDELQTEATKRDLSGPRRTRVNGVLELPSGVSTEDGCEGDVRVRIFDGTDRIRSRQVPLVEDCSYSHRFRLPGVAKLENENVKIKTKFLGNAVLKKEKADVEKTKVQDL